MLIEKIDVSLLNETADKVPLNMKRRVSMRGSHKRKQEEASQVNPSPVKKCHGRPPKKTLQEVKPMRKPRNRTSKTKERQLLKCVLGLKRKSPKKSPSKVSPMKTRRGGRKVIKPVKGK